MKKAIRNIILIIVVLVIDACYSYGHWGQSLYVQTADSEENAITNPIVDTMEIRQTFVSERNGFDGLKIKLLRSGDETVPEYLWQLLDDSGEEIASGTVGETEMETREFRDKKFLYIPVEEQPDSKGKQYTFILKADGATQNGCLSAYMAEGNEYAGNLAVNGENSENALVLKVIAKGFNAETFLVFLGLVAYVGLFVKFMYKLFR